MGGHKKKQYRTILSRLCLDSVKGLHDYPFTQWQPYFHETPEVTQEASFSSQSLQKPSGSLICKQLEDFPLRNGLPIFHCLLPLITLNINKSTRSQQTLCYRQQPEEVFTHAACCHRHTTTVWWRLGPKKAAVLSVYAAAPFEEGLYFIRFVVWRGGGKLGNLHGEKSKGGNMTTQMLIFETELHL